MTSITELKQVFKREYNDTQNKIGEKSVLEGEIKNIEKRLIEIQKLDELHSQCSYVLQQIETTMRSKTIDEIETLVTLAIQEILGTDLLKFKIVYEAKRNVVNAEFRVINVQTDTEYDIIHSFGGGLIDVISIALRIIFIYHSSLKKVLILDEIGKFISNDMQSRFGKFLKRISHELGIQIILISHKDQVVEYADRILQVSLNGDVSEVAIKL